MKPTLYCPSPFSYQKRPTREVMVGNVGVGGSNPIRIQSMLTSDTRDVEACIRETLDLVDAGCEIVRLTAQTKIIAQNLEAIKKGLLAQGCEVPLVADIHFKPDAAMEAAKWVEKIRVNPGNYVDKKKFQIREYTDDQYAAELQRIEEEFGPLVDLCKERGVAMRIGTNHGSLSDRIMNRYGDTPRGMVESALEFARIARDRDYHQFVFSMKASNPKVMIHAYRLLVARLAELGPDWNYPLHLGVTEAGDGEDGRIKSAVGIGSLLADGIGDTIRVSLTEDSIHEIPVAAALVASYNTGALGDTLTDYDPDESLCYDPFSYQRRATKALDVNGVMVGGGEPVRVVTSARCREEIEKNPANLGECLPELTVETCGIVEIDPTDDASILLINNLTEPHFVTLPDHFSSRVIPGFRLLATRVDPRHPVLLKDTLVPATVSSDEPLVGLLRAGTRIGSLLCDGIGDAVLIQGMMDCHKSVQLAYNILQAAGVRIFKTDYVACPSCGRTLFNLQETTARIREATGHLKGVRIAVMGCIVNGPGEMADADFGYVGGAPGKINLYVGKTPVEFNIPEIRRRIASRCPHQRARPLV
jgi:(E)-4-hydroxy-3-methylbut-2-enyl-diphosphate synthase